MDFIQPPAPPHYFLFVNEGCQTMKYLSEDL